MARLTAAQRKALPDSAFAGPNRSYPVNDRAHARNALSRVAQFGSSSEKKAVRSKVAKRYPNIGGGKATAFLKKRKASEVSDTRSQNPVMGGHKSRSGYAIPYNQDTSRSPYKRGNRSN